MNNHGNFVISLGNLCRWLGEQAEATGAVPDDRTLVVERFRDEIGDWRVAQEISEWIEIIAIGVISVAVVAAFAAGVRVVRSDGIASAVERIKQVVGRGLLLGLDLLIAADVIRTVTLEPTLENVAALGLLVVVLRHWITGPVEAISSTVDRLAAHDLDVVLETEHTGGGRLDARGGCVRPAAGQRRLHDLDIRLRREFGEFRLRGVCGRPCHPHTYKPSQSCEKMR